MPNESPVFSILLVASTSHTFYSLLFCLFRARRLSVGETHVWLFCFLRSIFISSNVDYFLLSPSFQTRSRSWYCCHRSPFSCAFCSLDSSSGCILRCSAPRSITMVSELFFGLFLSEHKLEIPLHSGIWVRGLFGAFGQRWPSCTVWNSDI